MNFVTLFVLIAAVALSAQSAHLSGDLNNLQLIKSHNAKDAVDFELGQNELSHIERHEFVRTHCKTMLPKVLMAERPVLNSTRTFNSFTLATLPESYSWRSYVSTVKNQQDCGSCWAFATNAMLQAVNKRKNGVGIADLSPQFLVDCDKQDHGCNGGWPTTALYFYKQQMQNKATKWSSYPYTARDGMCHGLKEQQVNVGIDEIFEFRFKGDDRLMRLRLANHGPLAIAMYVNGESGLFQNYRSGLFYEPGCPSTCKDVNHAMLLVGYGVTNDAQRRPYYLVQNSWGESWGEGGYVRIAADRGNVCNTVCYGMVSN